jgi:cytochrome d ubiquinol oxidase subunit I
MLCGMNRVGGGLHFAATAMIAVGTFLSAIWIRWSTHGCERFTDTSWARIASFCTNDWWQIVFNPSFL